ncbi:hypothetical protein INT45_010883 [Circinella minor]|uniref:Uncharacterized protein n=1 Tax=Circinella minor TaxID=1195481 RepID=A0A8H7VS13_9FUNG|nr:hypothetical protein INT45_010883 [Circinella minor]
MVLIVFTFLLLINNDNKQQQNYSDRNIFKKIYDEYKWTLSTGKVVKDNSYSYSSKCCYEDVSHSLILDMACDDIMKNFTKEEIEEIEKKSPHPLPEIPEQLLNYLNDFIALVR